MIPRLIQKNVIQTLLDTNKIIIILGARQTGKTTLISFIQNEINVEKSQILNLNCDLDEHFNLVNTTSLENLKNLIMGKKFLFLDEAQRLDNPGLTLKIIHDNFPEIKVLATGSSSFEIKNALSDALTGRYFDFTLFPLSYSEIISYTGQIPSNLLESVLTYGEFPEVYLEPKPEIKKALLSKITESFLFKDILSLSRIRSSQAIINLTKALAFQIGSEINENELSNRVKIDRKTLVSYLDILEKSFIIIKLHPYSQNPRREIGRRYKVYFVDLGIRNQLIGQFAPLSIRQDYGRIWENFLVIERRKSLSLSLTPPPCYFWRNLNGSEIDYLELIEGKINSFEFKLKPTTKIRFPETFTKTYNTTPKLITSANFLEFIKTQ